MSQEKKKKFKVNHRAMMLPLVPVHDVETSETCDSSQGSLTARTQGVPIKFQEEFVYGLATRC